ncbi:MAG: T9SS type A sorting domain-containing protein [Bacteroidetes bacterium]|nr:T9SS type A sorting domain-containing protein [Bacteroidota bacterium]
MKKFTLLIVLSIIIQTIGFSQPCPDSIGFTSQVQIDSFQINFPNCSEIEGLVFIGHPEYDTDIDNLEGLNTLTSIGGDLVITGTVSLTNLSGLENLNSIGGSLNFGANFMLGTTGNLGLISLEGLDNLTTIGGQLSIEHHPNLLNLNGLQNLTSIGYFLHIENNQSLTDISGVENINAGTISGLDINNNISLSTCDVQSICDYLAVPGSNVEIWGNAPGCNSQEEVEEACESTSCLPGGIYFGTQEEIDNFPINYPDCNVIEGSVGIKGDDITNLAGLSQITEINGDLRIGPGDLQGYFANPNLTSLSGLDNLTAVGGKLRIFGDTSLINLDGLENLHSVGGSLIIGMTKFISLQGLDNLHSIGGSLDISCGYLTTLAGLENLESVENLDISYCQALENINALSGLTEVGNNIEIRYTALTDLAGLDNITHIGGTLGLVHNPNLSDLSGLGNLTELNGFLAVYSNASLTSLTDLENIQGSSIENLIIKENPLLAQCDVESVCEFLASPNGTIEIWGNAPGCNSPEEVEEACLGSIKDNSEDIEFTIKPNPVSVFAEISLNSPGSRHIEISFFNTTGICVKSWQYPQSQTGKNHFILNLKEIPEGIYFCRVQAGNKVMTRKVVKL